ncbi:hypothetical protein BABINDRAFT_162693 [Babjeviella inositovora NRRL Y-12698]|uniref:C2H2-type domain-containing protein n=1 Tax=Babjeviella inositovora NRRL Y-12698 TaxID=984486 RepID=A0A1E3QLB7_9ASCO|nr:uncharacterized protein BABINDRAFT_162693 [Babjeviella inositovora NRRL Y-12698]ODQ78481.1 hypothetical protein BABINDRAFT_162693 [Babjeviella inositovora NRRL Y-12698]
MSSPYPVTLSSDNLESIILSKQPDYLGTYDDYKPLYSDSFKENQKAEENELTDFSYPKKLPKMHSFQHLPFEDKVALNGLYPAMDFDTVKSQESTARTGQISNSTTMSSFDSIPMLSHSISANSLQFSPGNLTQIPELSSTTMATPSRGRNRSASMYTTPLRLITSPPNVVTSSKVGKTPRRLTPGGVLTTSTSSTHLKGHTHKRSEKILTAFSGHARTPSAGNPFYTPRLHISPDSPEMTPRAMPTLHKKLSYGKGDEELGLSLLVKRKDDLKLSFSLDSIASSREKDDDEESLYDEDTINDMTILEDTHNTSFLEAKEENTDTRNVLEKMDSHIGPDKSMLHNQQMLQQQFFLQQQLLQQQQLQLQQMKMPNLYQNQCPQSAPFSPHNPSQFTPFNPFFHPPGPQRFSSGPVPTYTHGPGFLSRSQSSISLASMTADSPLNPLATPPATAEMDYTVMNEYMLQQQMLQQQMLFHGPVFANVPTAVDKKKNQECPLCKMRFLRPEHVKRHLKSHSSAKPFLCDVPDCGKRFNRKDNMKAHLRKIHGLDTKQPIEGQFLVKSDSDISLEKDK